MKKLLSFITATAIICSIANAQVYTTASIEIVKPKLIKEKSEEKVAVAEKAPAVRTTGNWAAANRLAGKWLAIDNANERGGLEVTDSTAMQLVYDGQKKHIIHFTADFTKTPAWFDFTIQDGDETITLKSIMQFISNDTIQWQVFDGDKRPDHFTSGAGDILYLKRRK